MFALPLPSLSLKQKNIEGILCNIRGYALTVYFSHFFFVRKRTNIRIVFPPFRTHEIINVWYMAMPAARFIDLYYICQVESPPIMNRPSRK